MPESPLLLIGRVRKAHGIKGEVSVDCYADFPELLRDGVFMQRGKEAPVFQEIASLRAHHGTILIRFAAFPDRTAAEQLRGCTLLIPEDRLPEPDNDEIYLYEIMGITVAAVDQNGKETVWGTLRDVTDAAGQELWTISRDGEEDVLFPATPEFILEFDLESRIVRISPPPGLYELYRP